MKFQEFLPSFLRVLEMFSKSVPVVETDRTSMLTICFIIVFDLFQLSI